MKINIFNVDEFVKINKLPEVTSPVLFQRGDIPDPNGLVSNELFGITIGKRKSTFGYIDLHGHFFHPHVYKVIKRFFRDIEKIVSGSEYFKINEEGHLIKDPEGDTGIDFLYKNWTKIRFEAGDSTIRNERVQMIMQSARDEVFMSKQIVIPPFYRDITTTTRGGTTGDINNMYTTLIRLSSLIENGDMFDFSFHSTNFNIQNMLVEIYDYFKVKLEKKNGIIRKYLMGKNVDYCTRTVITAPTFHADRPGELKIKMRRCGLPLAQCLSLSYPFVVAWIRNWFNYNVFTNTPLGISVNKKGESIEGKELDNPEHMISDKFIKKKVDQFIRDPESRFERITLKDVSGKDVFLRLSGKSFNDDSKDEVSPLYNRHMTWTDLFFIACVDILKDKHCMVTRYPISDQYGIFIAEIEVLSTVSTVPMYLNEQIYKYYPVIDFSYSYEEIATAFIDSTEFANCYLAGIGGDYDGDQTTIKILWSQEANDECRRKMNEKSFFLRQDGSMVRTIGGEGMHTIYLFTKNPTKSSKTLLPNEVQDIIDLLQDDVTFEKLTYLLSNFLDDNGKMQTARFEIDDVMELPPNTVGNTSKLKTTVGRYIFYKVLIERCELPIPFVNEALPKKKFSEFEAMIGDLLVNDKITVDQMYDYIDARDWLGYQCHAILTSSFTSNTIRIHPEVQKLKDELIKKYKTELEDGDAVIASKIEDELIKKSRELLSDDVGMTIYDSDTMASIGNNYKNIILMRGAVYNRATGKYEIMTNSLLDGLRREDIPISSNTILEGAYPKACGTAESGYLAKKLLASCQTEILDVKDSDCGSKRGIHIMLTSSNKSKFLSRYVIQNKKPVLLTDNNIDSFVGSEVELRSPMGCVGDKICNVCAGDFYYKVGSTSIGMSASKIATTLTNLNMKKFHNNVIKYTRIDSKHMLI